jgi:hypothetical protein
MPSSQWTFATGLRNACIHLALWSIAASAAWVGIVVLLLWLPPTLHGRFRSFLITFASAVGGLLAGWLLSRRASDAAGFTGAVLVILCMAAAAIADGVGISLAAMLTGAPISAAWFMAGVFFITAGGALLMTLWSDM